MKLLLLFLCTIFTSQSLAVVDCQTIETSTRDNNELRCGTFTNNYKTTVTIAQMYTTSVPINGRDGNIAYTADSNFLRLKPNAQAKVVLPEYVEYSNGEKIQYYYYVQAADFSEWGTSAQPDVCAFADLRADKGSNVDIFGLETLALIADAKFLGLCSFKGLTFKKKTELNFIFEASNRSFIPRNSGIPGSDREKENNLRTIQRLNNEISDFVGYVVNNLMEYIDRANNVVSKWIEQISPYLELNPLNINIADLDGSVPDWFVDLVKSLQKKEKKLAEDMQAKNEELARKLEENKNDISDLDEDLAFDLDEETIEEDLSVDEALADQIDSINEREEYWLNLLTDTSRNDRAYFTVAVRNWREESVSFEASLIKLSSEGPEVFSAFQKSQISIQAFIETVIDENGLFKDVSLSSDFKTKTLPILANKNPSMSNRLISALNKGQSSVKSAHLEAVSDTYVSSTDGDESRISEVILDSMITFMEVATDFATCLAKEKAAGPYAQFFEVWEGKSFCDGSNLVWWERGLSFTSLSADVGSKIGYKLAGVASLGITLQKLFRKVQPVFKKVKFEDIAGAADVIIEVAKNAKDLSLTKILETSERVFKSAKALGIKSKNLLGTTKEVQKIIKKNPCTAYNMPKPNILDKVLGISIDTAYANGPCRANAADIYEAAAKNKPLGKGSTGRAEPQNLQEQAALLVTRADPGKGKDLTPSLGRLGDDRWPASEGWVKMQSVFDTMRGKVTIHYVLNATTNAVDDFKFINNL